MNVPEYVKNILLALETAGYEAWCVGGCVRDSLMGHIPGDWDVTTSALPEETMAVFGDHAYPTGLQHGTVTVRALHESVEVTTYRVDGAYHDHRRPDSVPLFVLWRRICVAETLLSMPWRWIFGEH